MGGSLGGAIDDDGSFGLMLVARAGRSSALVLLAALLAGAGLASCAPFLARPTAPPLGLDEIIKMSQEGVPECEIVERIRSSGTFYRLRAEEVIGLHAAGVRTRVIDYIQDAYVEQVRREQRMDDRAYLLDGYWWGYGPPWLYWWYGPLPWYYYP